LTGRSVSDVKTSEMQNDEEIQLEKKFDAKVWSSSLGNFNFVGLTKIFREIWNLSIKLIRHMWTIGPVKTPPLQGNLDKIRHLIGFLKVS
jgi:hypothetical protein